MKKIEAVLTHSGLHKLMETLGPGGTRGITVTDVSRLAPTDRVLKVKVELVVNDEIAPLVLRAVESSKGGARKSGGRSYLVDIEVAVRIRTGERDQGVV